jgi:hypothetical protein
MKEIWKKIKGFEDKYEISNLGEIRNVKRYVRLGCTTRLIYPTLKKKWKNKSGVWFVTLSSGYKKTTNLSVAKLVARHFISEHVKNAYVCHIDGDTANNAVTNLKWGTMSEALVWRGTYGKSPTD